jgi:hypothetical protein
VRTSRAVARAGILPAKEDNERMAEAYCVKCKTKRQVQNAQNITMKNGKPALKGTCPVCGTSLFKIGG